MGRERVDPRSPVTIPGTVIERLHATALYQSDRLQEPVGSDGFHDGLIHCPCEAATAWRAVMGWERCHGNGDSCSCESRRLAQARPDHEGGRE